MTIACIKIGRVISLYFVLLTLALAGHAEDIDYRGIHIPDQSGQVMTVNGPINPEGLGNTLMHEHLFIDFFGFASRPDAPDRWKKYENIRHRHAPETEEELALWNEPVTVNNSRSIWFKKGLNRDRMTLDSMEDMVSEVLAYKNLGGQTIVDVTPDAILGRRPAELRDLSLKTGVGIVMATGFYEGPWHPSNMDSRTVDDLTVHMVHELVQGVDDTGIKAGIIGELSVTNLKFSPESNDLKVIRAAAHASRLTGAAISLHVYPPESNNIHAALDILTEEGADLSRVIVGHVPGVFPIDATVKVGFLETILRRGAYLQFDTLGAPFNHRGSMVNNFQVDILVELIKRGYSDQLLVSHDIFGKPHLTKYGGFGLTFIHAYLIPYLLENGIHQYQIDKITQSNPGKALAFAPPRGLEK